LADPRFFRREGPFSLGVLAEKVGASLPNGTNADKVIVDTNPLQSATADDISFIDNRRYLDVLSDTQAGACVAHPDVQDRVPVGTIALLSNDPYRAFAQIAQLFYPTSSPKPGIHPSAHVDPTASIAATVRIDAGAVIGEGAEVGDGSWIGANAVIGDGVQLGSGCRIGSGTTIQYSVIGDRFILHPGARIGQDGFGFAPGPTHEKVPQLGRVLIGDDVEIGANTCVDRGTGPDTVIGNGCKIDNSVQIAHNVRLGQHCLMAAQVGISGSTTIGHYAMIGGQAGFAGHLTIGNGVSVAAQSGIMRDLADKSSVCGSPAVPIRQFFRSVSALEHLSARKKDKSDG